ncbi:hypothetical protein EVAR_74632_1 [Eumeta japonica]|uniref:Uncharacterized protein n=1 Tax=Eumeta variegata TaxID=151549 RepID=A0A4C1WDB6_EUMVA|nr:hypothetical protein EVAR_74632_1 [Eumeta japonica]
MPVQGIHLERASAIETCGITPAAQSSPAFSLRVDGFMVSSADGYYAERSGGVPAAVSSGEECRRRRRALPPAINRFFAE